MSARVVLIIRYVAIAVLILAIALIIIRRRIPMPRVEGGGILSRLREALRRRRERREQERERAGDLAALRGKQALVVDPDEKSARILNWKLGSFGCKVFRARTGSNGLTRAQAENPDLFIIDALLPDIGALDFYNSAARPDAPFIFIGVLPGQRDGLRSIGRNVACLPKPFDPDEAALLAGLLLRRLESE